jgi:flagellar biosynthesis protein FlhF
MVTKTFKSETMLKALQMVQEELGADAIVVSTREIPTGPSWNPWKQSAIEIVAATPDTLPEIKNTQPAPKKAAPQAPVLRLSANKKEVEFVEETPEIEWVDDTEEFPAPAPYDLNSTRSKKSSSNVKPWEPPQVDKKGSPVVTKPVEPPALIKAPRTPPAAPNPVQAALVLKKTTPKTDKDESNLPAGLKKIRQQLSNQGVDEALIDGLMSVAIETLSPGTLADHENCKKYITQLLGSELRIQQGLGAYVPNNLVCLIGASGSGKTSTMAKLALFFSQKLKKTITWICADTVRVGAIAEARAYTDALGLNLKLVYSPEDLKEILRGSSETDLFLLDTPGYNPCSESQLVELGGLLAEIPKRCTYLVAPATTKEADLFQLSASLGVFNLDGLIITKLDETHIFGSVYNFARKNQVPLGFFTTGKEPARNLEVVDPARLVSALFGKEWNK